VQRLLFTCPSSEVNSINFKGQGTANIQPGGLEFGFVFKYTAIYCQQGYSLEDKIQSLGEKIISSLKIP